MAKTKNIEPAEETGAQEKTDKKQGRETSPPSDGILGAAKRLFHLGGEKVTTLEQLFVEQLKDLYSAEQQLVEALPKMAKAAHARPLKQGFQTHLKQTKEHARRLERVFKSLGEEPGGKTCKAMQGLVREGDETISEDATSEVKDAALIAAAQRVEHYEIAAYGCVRTYATLLGRKSDARVLGLTLKEEADTDKKLTAAAKSLNLKPAKR
jgi:ferritin-like metal-binding protein YciE